MCLSTCKQTSSYAFHNFPRAPFRAHAGYGEYPHTHTPHPKLAIILNPSPAWVIPDNPGLILVNSGHSSAGFHPETTETGWGLVGSWQERLGAALTDIIGWAVIGSQEKQAQVFPRGLQKYIRIDPLYVIPQPQCCCFCNWKTCFSLLYVDAFSYDRNSPALSVRCGCGPWPSLCFLHY